MAALELHLMQHMPPMHMPPYATNANQCIIGGKLFSSYMTLFELAQGLWDSKTSDLNY